MLPTNRKERKENMNNSFRRIQYNTKILEKGHSK